MSFETCFLKLMGNMCWSSRNRKRHRHEVKHLRGGRDPATPVDLVLRCVVVVLLLLIPVLLLTTSLSSSNGKRHAVKCLSEGRDPAAPVGLARFATRLPDQSR